MVRSTMPSRHTLISPSEPVIMRPSGTTATLHTEVGVPSERHHLAE